MVMMEAFLVRDGSIEFSDERAASFCLSLDACLFHES